MAAQCGVNNATMVNHHHPYVSSNAYYGYVPVVPAKNPADDVPVDGMDVDYQDNNNVQKEPMMMQQQQQFAAYQERKHSQFTARKRNLNQDDFTVYMPRFKRFREGDYHWSEEHRLAQMYNEPLLCLSPAADFDMACQRTTIEETDKKLQSPKSQEFEDMLLLTHGCSSYHHYRQTQVNQDESEF